MSAQKARRHGIVFFDSQQVAEPPRRARIAIAITAVVLVIATLVAVGVWRFVLAQG